MRLALAAFFLAASSVPALAAQSQSSTAPLAPAQAAKATLAPGLPSAPTTPPSNDDCSGALVLGPSGPYAFDLTGATTSTSAPGVCAGSNVIGNDIWFSWTAPTAGSARLTTCGLTTVDTKLAVYAGAGCPTVNAIACNDDACGFQSEVCFDVASGQTYTIQLGTFPGAATGNGNFDIILQLPKPPCTYDDGITDNLLAWNNGGDLVWLNRFGGPGTNTVIDSVDALWGSVLFPGYNPGNGTPSDICIWQDGASQDGNPSDATLLLQLPVTVANVDTDTYVHFSITPLTIAGVFFVGSHQVHNGNSGTGPSQFVAPLDGTCPTAGVAWFFGDNSGPSAIANLANPGANVQAPMLFESIGIPCQVCVRAGCSPGAANYFCFGDASVAICPCSNFGNPGRGCENSSTTGGALLTASGSASLASDSLRFDTVAELPTTLSILIQGTSSIQPTAFGDGLRCAGGNLKRLYALNASGGAISVPPSGSASVSARSSALGDPIQNGQQRIYQVYYADSNLAFCGHGFNVSNAAAIGWGP